MSAFLGLGKWWMSRRDPQSELLLMSLSSFSDGHELWGWYLGSQLRMIWHRFFCCSLKLFFPSPRTALSVGVKVGGTWRMVCIALPGYSLAFLPCFFLSASLPLVPLILLPPPPCSFGSSPVAQHYIFFGVIAAFLSNSLGDVILPLLQG